jgi:uncharacterized membrane protein
MIMVMLVAQNAVRKEYAQGAATLGIPVQTFSRWMLAGVMTTSTAVAQARRMVVARTSTSLQALTNVGIFAIRAVAKSTVGRTYGMWR